jgi:SAM-dependent methyltransferase
VGSVVALDRSQDMMKYGIENADLELGIGGGRRDNFAYVCGDMRQIERPRSNNDAATDLHFDAVWLLLGSMQHLLTNDDIIACFESINSVLYPGGTVVIELPHPRETFSMGECTKNGWTVPLVDEVDDDGNEKEYGELSIVWGDEDDDFDPVSQVRRFTISMELSIKDPQDIPQDLDTSPLFRQMTEDGKTALNEIVPLRLFTLQELDALARCAGLELVAKYGALAEDVSIKDEDEAYRMVCVLRKPKEET